MKLVLTSKGKDLKSEVDEIFGRCSYFCLLSPESMEHEFFENPAFSSAGGAGVKAAQWVINSGAKVLLTGNVGPKAFSTLLSGGVEIYTVKGVTLQEAVEKWKRGELKRLEKLSI
ncbi:MAG TPA: dinitrogenase iron-molybdenum cofactor biosynthesis protein [Thermoplasmata archaeon]|nr:dinitrogenase iron-molybdenum cofactor biosynthesis protein [Thermoplasmata archaeon]